MLFASSVSENRKLHKLNECGFEPGGEKYFGVPALERKSAINKRVKLLGIIVLFIDVQVAMIVVEQSNVIP